MFDFAWSEIVLIGVVALIAIGPKDLPIAMKAVSNVIKKARRMASEFQTHVDEMVREANLEEVRSQINEIRNFDIKGTVERAIDPDGGLRQTFNTNPLQPTPTWVPPATPTAIAPPAPEDGAAAAPLAEAAATPPPMGVEAPAFVPPEYAVPPPPPPAFIPPSAARPPRLRA
ncbi:Sec-independent protein translocase protein TatB [Rhodovastum atsumiense]|uniref:Sec-independent protein translocase protein TatB n=1 Tax=Rhodovastum atsumiense TaxID=504468 RepID=A0A5M6IM32_9PROT|nr:Sec-independent protein translocase protein TatB [Rhodovastum atsumiense]KAA5609296.1 twin-arginine translocase subunit TatB [Rhodovastum atsumiense]CAH2604598.1 Sec-independent protein translocase protein TatB [Rhodovastum atsumiense]